jgi:Leucine-rich repeat (LRR) protein
MSIFIDSSFIETLRLSVKGYKIRTFLQTFDKYKFLLMSRDESTLNTLLLSFKSLRALDFHGLRITRVPNSIGKLIHLKYLDLTYSTIETLPDSITRLWNLQTLKLKGC